MCFNMFVGVQRRREADKVNGLNEYLKYAANKILG